MNKFFAMCLICFWSVGALAIGPQCFTSVTTIRVSHAGNLYISAESISNNKYILLCNVASVKNGVAIDTCKSWQSFLQTAQVSEQRVLVSYKYAQPDIATCDDVPVTNPPAPYFVQLIK